MEKVKVRFKLKEVLENRKMTQKELAQKSGVREATISDIVRGTRTVINFSHLADIVTALEIMDIREIMDFESVKSE
jgi:putative transcriptional regulator